MPLDDTLADRQSKPQAIVQCGTAGYFSAGALAHAQAFNRADSQANAQTNDNAGPIR